MRIRAEGDEVSAYLFELALVPRHQVCERFPLPLQQRVLVGPKWDHVGGEDVRDLSARRRGVANCLRHQER